MKKITEYMCMTNMETSDIITQMIKHLLVDDDNILHDVDMDVSLMSICHRDDLLSSKKGTMLLIKKTTITSYSMKLWYDLWLDRCLVRIEHGQPGLHGKIIKRQYKKKLPLLGVFC